MNPAFSVVFLTTLIGAGQGLFLVLYAAELGARFGLLGALSSRFYVQGAAVAVALLVAGLAASFFHLGRPERAWRTAAMWRTSWLSREVIVLPAFIAAAAGYGLAHAYAPAATVWLGALGVLLCAALFLCTAMIYACLEFLQEWHTPLTLWNFVLLGTASGLTLACALAAFGGAEPALRPLGIAAIAASVAALGLRLAILARNARLAPRSSLQSAIGVAHPRIEQKSQGQMGGSFNTREFFHGRGTRLLRAIKWIFLILGFPLPAALLAAGLAQGAPALLALAFVVQYFGLIAERWFFFAQARHPQNLYYQTIS
jgi:sulfite dehydrogenase (quinone) subunit SoeC